MHINADTDFSYLDWISWPEPENGRLELIDGRATIRNHNDRDARLSLLVAGLLATVGYDAICGIGLLLGGDTVLQPDVCIMAPPGDPEVFPNDGLFSAAPIALSLTGKLGLVQLVLDVGQCRDRLALYAAKGLEAWALTPQSIAVECDPEQEPNWLLAEIVQRIYPKADLQVTHRELLAPTNFGAPD